MATHRLKMTLGATLDGWDDISDGEHASRVNPAPGSPVLYWRVRIVRGVAAHGKMVCKAQAVPVEGDTALLDGALGGNLFTWSWGEIGAGGPPILTTTVGQSSEVNFAFTQENPGHWLLTALRPNNGAACFHIWVDVV